MNYCPVEGEKQTQGKKNLHPASWAGLPLPDCSNNEESRFRVLWPWEDIQQMIIVALQRCPHPSPQNLGVCYLAWPRGTEVADGMEIVNQLMLNGKITLDYPVEPM